MSISTLSAAVAAAKDQVGRRVSTDWFAISQVDVTEHGVRNGEDDWVHMDPDRAVVEGLAGGRTIVQGSMLLSRVIGSSGVLPMPSGAVYALNYGFDRVRFVSPAPVGEPLRVHYDLTGVKQHRAGLLSTADVTMETRTATVLVARWLGLAVWPESDRV